MKERKAVKLVNLFQLIRNLETVSKTIHSYVAMRIFFIKLEAWLPVLYLNKTFSFIAYIALIFNIISCHMLYA